MKADGGGGALVYVILAVISLIVSAIGKNKNKVSRPVAPRPETAEPEHQPQQPATTWQKELEDIFGKVLTEPEVVVDKPRPQDTFSQTEVKKEVPKETMSSNVYELNKYAASKKANAEEAKKAEHSGAIHVLEEEHENHFHIEEFELQKAVIYAEVLNRKYI